MAMTNAISGMTIVGGMLQLGGGILPHTIVRTKQKNPLFAKNNIYNVYIFF